ncbi:MAG: hypothetical protein IJS99_00750 [Synergistaceae bacterium]|nr:hypothetical protein [Synergistaceae bacterium]
MTDNERYVREEVFNESMRKIDERFAKIDERFAKVDERFNAIENRLADMSGEIKSINARIEGVIDTFSVAINGLNSRIDDIRDSQAYGAAKWGIIVAFFVGIVQVATSVILHFWK